MAKGEAAKKRVMHRVAHRRKQENRFSMIMVALVVFLLAVVVGVRAIGLTQKLDTLTAQQESVQQRIDDEMARSEEIEEYGKETKTKKFFEKIAKEKLGLVYEDEILFKRED